jgi:riboflavin kinase/FMN adenylyltransferase
MPSWWFLLSGLIRQPFLRPELGVQLLTTYTERAELIEAAGAEILVEQPFSRDFSSTRADEFFNQTLIQGLNAKAIVVGYDFAFGKGRGGNLERLKALCEESGVELLVVPAYRPDGEDVVSSSRVRACLGEAQVKEAKRLLGYSFFYRGLVRRGEGRGRQIGFPTANLQIESKVTLPYGVYATFTQVDGETVIHR